MPHTRLSRTAAAQLRRAGTAVPGCAHFDKHNGLDLRPKGVQTAPDEWLPYSLYHKLDDWGEKKRSLKKRPCGSNQPERQIRQSLSGIRPSIGRVWCLFTLCFILRDFRHSFARENQKARVANDAIVRPQSRRHWLVRA